MPQYLSPGVYVEEVPSAVKPIAGVGTSTAGFIGVVPDTIYIPLGAATEVPDEQIRTGDGKTEVFNLKHYPVQTAAGSFTIKVGDEEAEDTTLSNDDKKKASQVTFGKAPANGKAISGSYLTLSLQITGEQIGTGDGKTKVFSLRNYPVQTAAGSFTIKAGEEVQEDAKLSNDDKKAVSQVKLENAPDKDKYITGDYVALPPPFEPAKEVKLCTNFGEFKKFFGDFSADPGQNWLAHAVYGFFNNGGTRCYVMRVTDASHITTELLKEKFAPIDEIALVAVPGVTDNGVQQAILAHCEDTHLQDRFAILDGKSLDDKPEPGSLTPAEVHDSVGPNSYGAIYFPWIQVSDPATRRNVFVPPSGHLAGVYARVDAERGVHKAPANEVVRGALGVQTLVSKREQAGLNPDGINVIRQFNGNVTVWGARTLGGDANNEWKYVNVRRLFLYLRQSIDRGTQWVVFEPNTPALWAKITRNITAFLTNVWRAGALFGDAPQQAFYVKCDEETNPPEVRDLGQVVTEIGVAVVKPAEFVVFRISQWAGPGG
jgi:phage tail sheath protein FI